MYKIKHSSFCLILIFLLFGFPFFYKNTSTTNYENPKSREIEQVTRRAYHKLLLWVAAYGSASDQYVVHHLEMCRNICESSQPHSYIRLFVGTCANNWNVAEALLDFRKRNNDRIINGTINVNISQNLMLTEHFNWSCVEFMIGWYQENLELALPFQHREYFRDHQNEFDWFWFTEDDILFHSDTYWDLFDDTSFTLNKLSIEQTNHLLNLYAQNATRPKLSPLGRYFLLPSALRFEKPSTNETSTTNGLELWRLTDLALAVQPMIEALIFFKDQWWIQPSSPHTAYYILPRQHITAISKESQWLNKSNSRNREFVSSHWLSHFGYIRITSITNYNQYLIHHASNRYYDEISNLPVASIFTRQLGFEYQKNNKFVPTKELINAHLLDYTNEHQSDIGLCFPLSFSPIPGKLHYGKPICEKLLTTLNKAMIN